ncbi:MAG: PDZ domain-containing protein [Bacteroidia bacterium]
MKLTTKTISTLVVALLFSFQAVVAGTITNSKSTTKVLDVDLGIEYSVAEDENEIGISIDKVFNNSMGKAIGLQPNDILIGIGNQPIQMASLEKALSDYKPGDDVLLRVNRNGKYHEIKTKMPAIAGANASKGKLGIELKPLAKQNKVGAKIKKVEKGSAANHCGLKYGDILLGINNKPVVGHNVHILLNEHNAGELVNLRIQRNGKLLNITTVLGK